MVLIPPSARVSSVEKLYVKSFDEHKVLGEIWSDLLGVASSSVPLSLEGLGVKGNGDSPLLSDPDEQEPRIRERHQNLANI